MKQYLSVFSLLLALHGMAAAQTGQLKGRVTTSDGLAAPGVSVVLKGGKAGTISNENGLYHLTRIPPGTQTVAVSMVGLQSFEKTVAVKSNQVTVLDFVLDASALQLQEVTVTHGSNLKPDMPSSGLRLTSSLIETPQNIQTVTGEVLAGQQIVSMSDGLIRNVSGANRVEHWGDLYTNITMRGSQIQAFRNGFNVVSSFWGPLTEDMSFVDRIEFVKGPAGFMVSNGDPSGLYNVVTKKPTGRTRNEVTVTAGSYELYRAALDLDGKLSNNGKWLYRLNIAAQKKKSHRPLEHNDRYSIAPVIRYKLSNKSTLTAEYNLQLARMSDVGSYYVFSPAGYGSLPREFTTMPKGLEPTKINDHSAYLSFEHQFSSQWKLTVQSSYFNYRQQGTSLWPYRINQDGTMIRSAGIWDARSEMKMGQVFVNGDIHSGRVRHKILAGADLGNKNYLADWGQSHLLDDTLSTLFNIWNPDNGVPSNGYPHYDRRTSLRDRAVLAGGLMDSKYQSIYLQDELGFWNNKVRLTVAGRFTNLSQSSWGEPAVKGRKFTPRAGLSVSLSPYMSVYALYDQAFIPQNGKLSSGKTVKPVTGNNVEFGIKKDWYEGKWNTTLTVYRILKNNELTADPNAPVNSGLSVVLGQKRAQGIEFDVRGQLAPGLTLIANYAYTDSRVGKVTEGVTAMAEGDLIPGFCKHTANAWLSYRLQKGILKGLGVASGFSSLNDRATGSWSKTETRLPDYFKLDGGISWENKKVRVTANVFNLLDKYLYNGAYYDYLNVYSWQSEPPRNYRIGLTCKF